MKAYFISLRLWACQENAVTPLESYLTDRLQKVILNGQTSSWRLVLAGIPKGSILATLLFLVYINDLPGELKSNAELLPMTSLSWL